MCVIIYDDTLINRRKRRSCGWGKEQKGASHKSCTLVERALSSPLFSNTNYSEMSKLVYSPSLQLQPMQFEEWWQNVTLNTHTHISSCEKVLKGTPLTQLPLATNAIRRCHKLRLLTHIYVCVCVKSHIL